VGSAVVASLAVSLDTYGQLAPVVCYADASGHLRLIAGERRLEATRRLHAARVEIGLAISAGYEYWVVNEDLERAYQDLEAIVRAEECRTGRRPLAPDLTD